MSKFRHRRLTATLVLAAAAHVHADCGTLRIEQAHIVAGPPGTPVLAGYAVLRNPGDSPVTVTGIDSDAFGAIEIHRMSMENGSMQMRPETTLVVPPHDRIDIRPGERHLMLSDPRAPLKPGDHAAVQFHCGNDTLAADFAVQAP